MSAKNTDSHLRVRMLCEGAMMVALAQVLSYIKLMELPNGGSLTPAMFPIILFAVRWGLTPGLMAGFTFGLLQLIFDGAYAWGWQSMLLDYLVAFTPLGLAGLFKGKKWGIFVGTVVGCLGRFVVHYISGVTIYKILAPTEFMKWTFTSPSAYSLVYNGSYMLPNTIIALVIAAVLYKPLKKYILGQDLGKDAVIDLLAVLIILGAGLGGDGEALRHGQTDVGHLSQVGALAAQKFTHVGVAFREQVTILLAHRNSPSIFARNRQNRTTWSRWTPNAENRRPAAPDITILYYSRLGKKIQSIYFTRFSFEIKRFR